MPAITFVLNDESQTNTYGFRVSNKYLSLARFDKNPVMLQDHWWGTESVIGRWENVRIEGSQLLADAVFDVDMDAGARIAGQVERGFLRGCSIGFYPKFVEVGADGVDTYGGVLLEASICAIPSNGGSVALYADAKGEQLKAVDDSGVAELLKAVKLSAQQANNNQSITKQQPITMTDEEKKELENLKAQVTRLTAEREDYKSKYEAHLLQVEKEKKAAVELSVNDAIKAGKITVEEKEQFIELGITNNTLLAHTLNKLPPAKSLTDALSHRTLSGDPEGGNEFAGIDTLDKLMQLGPSKGAEFARLHPERYKALVAPITGW